MPICWLPFRLRLIMVSLGFVTCDSPGQKGHPLSIKTLQQLRTYGFPLMSVLGSETSRNLSCDYLRKSQSVDKCLCSSIVDWKLYGQLPICDARPSWIMSLARCNICGLVAVARPTDCGGSCSSMSPLPEALTLWTQHTKVCECSPLFLSLPLKI